MDYLLPSEDETLLRLHFPGVAEPLVLDALDVDLLIGDIQEKGIPEDSDFYAEFAYAFRTKYGIRISKSAAMRIITIGKECLEAIKKKSLPSPEQSGSTEQVPVSQPENSDSST